VTGAASRRSVPPAPATTEGGLVVASRRRHFVVRLDDGAEIECVLKGRRTTLACGDRVRVARAAGGGVIEAMEPRTSLLYRSDAFKEKLIAANVTQVIGVVAPDLAVDLDLVSRWAVACEAERCRLVLVANKSDLPDHARLLAQLAPYAALGYAIVPLAAKRDIEPLLRWLGGQHSVLIGQSGMGKSTILNAIAPGALARTAEVSAALATGRHTTTYSTLYPLPAEYGDGWIVDSPGMKAFGLAHLDPDGVAHAFVELRPLLGHCRFRDCRHDREPGCAVTAAVDAGGVAPHRVALLHALLAESAAARGHR
jgi:ribosome biogenesis GTPase